MDKIKTYDKNDLEEIFALAEGKPEGRAPWRATVKRKEFYLLVRPLTEKLYRIAYSLLPDDLQAELTITDRGIGIPPEELSDLFMPFRRRHATARTSPGVGLGLWIVRRIVTALGGEIDVQSKPGVGSTFRVRLPLVGLSTGYTDVLGRQNLVEANYRRIEFDVFTACAGLRPGVFQCWTHSVPSFSSQQPEPVEHVSISEGSYCLNYTTVGHADCFDAAGERILSELGSYMAVAAAPNSACAAVFSLAAEPDAPEYAKRDHIVCVTTDGVVESKLDGRFFSHLDVNISRDGCVSGSTGGKCWGIFADRVPEELASGIRVEQISVSTGQACVLYDGDECLGGGTIVAADRAAAQPAGATGSA
jgi:hypothetical protein